jgi:hypothetical protein
MALRARARTCHYRYMRTKPITRDEIRYDVRGIVALPINSVRKGKNGLEPIKKLWAPLLRSLNEAEKKHWESMVEFRAAMGWESKGPTPIMVSRYGWAEYYCHHCTRAFYRLNDVGYYCSNKCEDAVRRVSAVKATKARSEQRAAERAKHNNKCNMCGKPITAKRSTMKFCSIRCRVAAHRERIGSD